ncbi:MAG TPA: F0F1 ATP synthase subunit A [Hyphomicrobiaceae bacterium]|nr:F0F1 ATP synthase subunit A [Hyphomicrobiaceae bacterium]
MAAGADGGHSPIAQFEIKNLVPLRLFGFDTSFTNSALFMVVAVGLISAFLIMSMRGRSLVPTRMQSIAEVFYEFVANTVRENVGQEGMKFFPLVFSLFVFVLICNLIGMVPGGFTVTSHIVVTAALALLVIGIVIVYGVATQGTHFLKLFVPDVPAPLLVLMVPIEVISFLSRPLSLSVRLFANMLAGHIALKIFAGFVGSLLAAGVWGIISPLPLFLTIALTALEVLVAVLQAYVFAVLTCVYLHDAVHGAHH